MPRASLQGLSMDHLHILAQLSWLPPVEQPWSPAAVWTRLALANLQQVPPSYVLLSRCFGLSLLPAAGNCWQP